MAGLGRDPTLLCPCFSYFILVCYQLSLYHIHFAQMSLYSLYIDRGNFAHDNVDPIETGAACIAMNMTLPF